MIEIKKVFYENKSVLVEYENKGIIISTKVFNTKELTSQEIIEKGYTGLKPHVEQELERLGIEPDTELEIVEDKILEIEVKDVCDINFIEGGDPVENVYEVVGKTMFGKEIELPSKAITITPTEDIDIVVRAEHEGHIDVKTFRIYYKALADIEAERIAREEQQAQWKLDEADMILKAPPTIGEVLESLKVAGQLFTADLIRSDSLSKEQMVELIGIYPRYEIGKAYKVGDIFTLGNEMFEVIQAHTSLENWIPKDLPALYKSKNPAIVIPEWVQPMGVHDSYKVGDQVIFETKIYESLIDANTWSPTAYPQGWKEIV